MSCFARHMHKHEADGETKVVLVLQNVKVKEIQAIHDFIQQLRKASL